MLPAANFRDRADIGAGYHHGLPHTAQCKGATLWPCSGPLHIRENSYTVRLLYIYSNDPYPRNLSRFWSLDNPRGKFADDEMANIPEQSVEFPPP